MIQCARRKRGFPILLEEEAQEQDALPGRLRAARQSNSGDVVLGEAWLGGVAGAQCRRIRLSFGLQSNSSFFSTVPKGLYDVLLCENDILALAAMDVLRYELGLRVPDDIAVTGFDDIDLASARSYDLTTYRQPFDEMVRQLVEMITGRKRHRTLKLTGELQVRSST